MDPFDAELKQSLKSWGAKQTPPANGRARLLGAVASLANQVERPAQFHFEGLPNEMFSWALVYSMERGVAALRLVS
jgi:hypothetical protein